MSVSMFMDFDLDFVNPQEEEGFGENEEGEGVNQPHSGDKLNKCNQCDYAFSQAGHLRIHFKTHSGEKSNNVPNVTLHLLMWAI